MEFICERLKVQLGVREPLRVDPRRPRGHEGEGHGAEERGGEGGDEGAAQLRDARAVRFSLSNFDESALTSAKNGAKALDNSKQWNDVEIIL